MSKESKFVYVASPYTKGDVALNVRRSIEAADRLAREGFVPFAPLLFHFWHMQHPHEYGFWTAMDLAWLERCDCIVRLPGDSLGADAEVARARELGLDVFLGVDELIATKYCIWEDCDGDREDGSYCRFHAELERKWAADDNEIRLDGVLQLLRVNIEYVESHSDGHEWGAVVLDKAKVGACSQFYDCLRELNARGLYKPLSGPVGWGWVRLVRGQPVRVP